MSDQKGMSRREFIAGALGLAAVTAAEACTPKPEQPKEKEPIAKTQSGDWELDVRAVGLVLMREEKRTVYHFIKKYLEAQPWFPAFPKDDQESVINGYIALIRHLNPSVDIDTYANVEGTPLQFPVELDVTSHPSTEISKDSGGYRRVQELAKADGFDIAHENNWETIYEQALVHTVEVPQNSPYYNLDREGSEDSEARLEQDVLDRLVAMGKDFASRTFGGRTGWKLSLTDLMRSPAVQKARHAGERNPVLATTLYTGRTFDLADGRFIDPDGRLVTWSNFDAQGKGTGPSTFATMIDAEMRPVLLEVMQTHGFYPYREGSHWHAYAPKDHHVDLRALEAK